MGKSQYDIALSAPFSATDGGNRVARGGPLFHLPVEANIETLTARLDKVQADLSSALESRPDAVAQLIDDGTMVYLEVKNSGAGAEFYAMLETTGVSQWPNKETFGRWDAVHNTERRKIANGARAKLRLAKREHGTSMSPTFRWIVYGKTSWEHFELPSVYTTLITSQPPSDEWNVTLSIEVLADPDLRNGPLKVFLVLFGNALFTQSA